MLVLCDPAFFFVDAPYSSGRVGLNTFSVKKESQLFPGTLVFVEECACLGFENYMLMELLAFKDGLPENSAASPLVWCFKCWLPIPLQPATGS